VSCVKWITCYIELYSSWFILYIYIKRDRRRADVLVVDYSDYVSTANSIIIVFVGSTEYVPDTGSWVVCECRSSKDGDEDYTGKTNEERRYSVWTEEGRWSQSGEKFQDQDDLQGRRWRRLHWIRRPWHWHRRRRPYRSRPHLHWRSRLWQKVTTTGTRRQFLLFFF